ncbi:hypothetical protein PNOK_0660700 [Pyrrhoderma noxium]|uniref:MARVEL domain-containing protein n=1 Tax=Pyrrhoderma noxium TaxID=2282107 RepID=A0A286UEV4_9AGAM|nr:hypothetical protein PNOK_0660700 [Pyrrhoderma noxium]
MKQSYTKVGRNRLKAIVLLLFVNIIVLALSARVNQVQGFFFMADLFPLGLSIATLVVISVSLLLDLVLANSITSRPPFDIFIMSTLTILWLASNSFSTSRWRHVPLNCASIPDDFKTQKVWCKDLQALKAFVWIEWVTILLIALFTLRYVVMEHVQGNKHIWRTALSRYSARTEGGMHRRSSSFFTGLRESGHARGDSFARL